MSETYNSCYNQFLEVDHVQWKFHDTHSWYPTRKNGWYYGIGQGKLRTPNMGRMLMLTLICTFITPNNVNVHTEKEEIHTPNHIF